MYMQRAGTLRPAPYVFSYVQRQFSVTSPISIKKTG